MEDKVKKYFAEYQEGSTETITTDLLKYDITDVVNSALHIGKMYGADDLLDDEAKDGLIDCNPLSLTIKVLEDLEKNYERI